MASLMEMSAASQDAAFIGRVQAAASIHGLPFDPAMVMHVATRADLSAGPDGVDDGEIIALLRPESMDPTVLPADPPLAIEP